MHIAKLSENNNVPVIENWTLSFWWKQYTIEEFDFEVPEELKSTWALWGSKRKEWILQYRWVPQEFLPYALAHEAICGVIDGSWTCCDSIKEEINWLPETLKDAYIERRIAFFEWMCTYAKNGMKNPAHQEYFRNLLQEMEQSLAYLKLIKDKSNDLTVALQ